MDIEKSEKQPSEKLRKADKTVFNISKYFSYLGGFAVILALLMSVIDIVLVKVFSSSLPSTNEWVTYLNLAMIFPGLAYVELERGHTDVRLFDNKFPPIVTRIIRIFSLLLAAGVMLFLTWRGFICFQTFLKNGDMSSTNAFQPLAFKIWIFALVYFLGNLACFLSFVWTIVRVVTDMSIFNDPPLKGRRAKNVK